MRNSWGWAGTVDEFLATPRSDVIDSLSAHHMALLSMRPSATQLEVWTEEHEVMTATLTNVVTATPSAADWGIVFEFELPLEGGRRPDVVVLTGSAAAVIEFKATHGNPLQAHVDQVSGYARDLADYHEATRHLIVTPLLVMTKLDGVTTTIREVAVTSAGGLADHLASLAEGDPPNLKEWLLAPYAPLPSLVAAAQRIFNHEPLPHVKTAQAAGIPETVDLVAGLAEEAKTTNARKLVLVTGVPGSGKTLVGLRVVYEHAQDEAIATFLSGNGPLVKVLRHALGSGVFVRDLHAFIKSYGMSEKVPRQHLLVFDEAQRAWDRSFMQIKRDVHRSEPDLLIEIGQTLPGWAVLVGLVGDGQEIYSGEEAGMTQWREAIVDSPDAERWEVHCPPELAGDFADLNVTTHPELNLTISLRSRRAEQLHEWVDCLVHADLGAAAALAEEIHAQSYPLYITRDLNDARAYARDRFDGEADKRYGLVASSHAKALPSLGVNNSWLATSRIKEGPWFNAPQDDPLSCCALTQPVTEFGCQGLELDLPILCWGEDFRWDNGDWALKPIRRKYPQKDPNQILRNVYRVLLTRGRDGVVIWVPSLPDLDDTADALVRAGVEPLPA